MLKLLQFELGKIYKSKVTIVAILFFSFITINSAMNYSTSNASVDNIQNITQKYKEQDKEHSYLTGVYNKTNYKELLQEHQALSNKIKENAYTSTKQCTYNSDLLYDDFSEYLKREKDNCEKIEDVKKAGTYMSIYFTLSNMFEYSIKDSETGISSKEYFIQANSSNSGGYYTYSPLSNKAIHSLADKIESSYSNAQMYYEPFQASIYRPFIQLMGSRTIHYITFILIIGLCSLFTRDTQKQVREYLLTTKKGRSSVIYARILSSLIFSISVFLLLTLITFFTLLIHYDIKAGALSLQFLYFYSIIMLNQFQFTAIYIGILALCSIATSCFIAFVSSICKHNFISFICGLFLIYSPVVFISEAMFFQVSRFSLINTTDIEQIISPNSGIDILGSYLSFILIILILYVLVICISLLGIRYRERKTQIN